MHPIKDGLERRIAEITAAAVKYAGDADLPSEPKQFNEGEAVRGSPELLGHALWELERAKKMSGFIDWDGVPDALNIFAVFSCCNDAVLLLTVLGAMPYLTMGTLSAEIRHQHVQ